jgi:hypothetical protein
MREANAFGFGHQSQQRAIGVKRPGLAFGHNLKARFILAVDELAIRVPGCRAVGQVDGGGADPLDVDNSHRAVGDNTLDGCPWMEVFETGHGIGGSRFLLLSDASVWC